MYIKWCDTRRHRLQNLSIGPTSGCQFLLALAFKKQQFEEVETTGKQFEEVHRQLSRVGVLIPASLPLPRKALTERPELAMEARLGIFWVDRGEPPDSQNSMYEGLTARNGTACLENAAVLHIEGEDDGYGEARRKRS